MRTGVIDKVLAMRRLREKLFWAGLPNPLTEYDVLGNVCAELGVNRQTAHTYDYSISVIDGVEPLLSRNIARKAIDGAASE